MPGPWLISGGVNELVTLVLEHGEAAPERAIFGFMADGESEPEPLTYGALAAGARAVAAWLQARQVGSEPVLVACPTSAEFVIALLGCFFAGSIAVPVPPPSMRRMLPRLAAIAAHAGARTALTTSVTLAAAAAHMTAHPELQNLQWQTVETIEPGRAADWRPQTVDPAATCLLQYSSGSTGAPKGVMLNHTNLLASMEQIGQISGMHPLDVGVNWLPLYHDMGLNLAVLAPLLQRTEGGRSIMMPHTAFIERPLRWLAAISRHRGTLAAAPNSIYALCSARVSAEARAQLDLSSWRVALCGAEMVRPATLEIFAQAFTASGFRAEALRPGYGLAEASLAVTATSEPRRPSTLLLDRGQLAQGRAVRTVGAGILLAGSGWPAPGVTIRIIHPVLRTLLPEGEVGEIWVQGANVAQGYWNDPPGTEAAFGGVLAGGGEGPFLRTGDLGFFNNGELFVTGRSKDLLIANGENYYPEDVELSVLNAHGAALSDAAAFAVDRGESEQIVLLLERRREWRNAADPARLQELAQAARRSVAVASGLQLNMVAVVRPASLPRTTSGKVQRFRCRELFLAGELAIEGDVLHCARDGMRPADEVSMPSDQTSAGSRARNIALELLAAILQAPVTDPMLELPVTDLGLGSLQLVLLRVRFQERTGMEVPLEWFGAELTLHDLLGRLDRLERLADAAPGEAHAL